MTKYEELKWYIAGFLQAWPDYRHETSVIVHQYFNDRTHELLSEEEAVLKAKSKIDALEAY